MEKSYIKKYHDQITLFSPVFIGNWKVSHLFSILQNILPKLGIGVLPLENFSDLFHFRNLKMLTLQSREVLIFVPPWKEM